MNIRLLTTLLLIICSTACSHQGTKGTLEDADSIFVPRHAQGFQIAYYGHSAVVTVKKPWQQANTQKHIFISRNGESAPTGFVGPTVKAPLGDVVCMSSSYTAFLDALGVVDAVRGVSGIRYTTNDTLKARYLRGAVRDVGIDSGVNYELLSSLDPDLIFVYGVGGESSVVTNKIAELNLKVAYVGDYLESTALGKAEWLCFFGELFDRQGRAQQLFDSIQRRYNTARELAQSANHRPVVMLNAPWRDVWFVPSDSTYMVSLIGDAGAKYACAGTPGDRSRPMSSEAAFEALRRSDYWLHPNSAKTMDELRGENQKFISASVATTGRVFNNNLRATPDGGSDFWEGGVVHPDVVLLDLIKIFHPSLLPNHTLYYYRELK